jgi:hypothetical protein
MFARARHRRDAVWTPADVEDLRPFCHPVWSWADVTSRPYRHPVGSWSDVQFPRNLKPTNVVASSRLVAKHKVTHPSISLINRACEDALPAQRS